jgi:hypothetical protein
MKKIIKVLTISGFFYLTLVVAGCTGTGTGNSDSIQSLEQEQLTREATQQTGMPAIVNFTERKQLKRIIELRDRSDYIM